MALIGFVPNPLLGVTRHIVSAPGADALLGSNRKKAGTAKIADGDDESGGKRSRSAVPVVDGGQSLAREFGVGGGFVPANAGNGIVILAFRVFALRPVFWPRLAGAIAEKFYTLLPGEGFSVLLKVHFPILVLQVSALIDECFELAVGDFVLVDPVILELQLGYAFVTGDDEVFEVFRG